MHCKEYFHCQNSGSALGPLIHWHVLDRYYVNKSSNFFGAQRLEWEGRLSPSLMWSTSFLKVFSFNLGVRKWSSMFINYMYNVRKVPQALFVHVCHWVAHKHDANVVTWPCWVALCTPLQCVHLNVILHDKELHHSLTPISGGMRQWQMAMLVLGVHHNIILCDTWRSFTVRVTLRWGHSYTEIL